MRLIGLFLAVSAAAAMAAAAPRAQADQPQIRFLCARDECSCEEQNGLELVTCDCRGADDHEPLMLGARNKAYLSDRTQSLRVRNCNRVSVVTEALSHALSLTDLELSDIANLELQASSMYTDDGPRRRVTVQRVGDLQVHPEAFSQVTQLQALNIAEVTTGALPLDGMAEAADVVNMHITNTVAEDLRILIGKADNVTVSKCKLDSINVDIGDVLSVTIADNTMKRVDALRINVRQNAHSTDTNDLTIERNTIQAMDTENVQLTLDTFELVNNTFGSLTSPVRVEFTTAVVTGNEIGSLGPSVFSEFIRLDPVNLRFGENPQEFAFTFADNTLRAASNGSYGLFLTPADERDGMAALFRVHGNRFACRCEEMKELVQIGESEHLKRSENNDEDQDDGLLQLEDVYGALYSSSRCVEDDQALNQYRLTAFSDDFDCVKATPNGNGASSAAAAALTVLLAAFASLGITV